MESGNNIFWILSFLFLISNVVSFVIMSMDKGFAIQGKRRVSEGDLFFLSICFGALGVLLAMKFVRHKTQKIKFIIGVPLALVQNVVCLYSVLKFLQTVY